MEKKNTPEGSGLVYGLVVFVLGVAIALSALFGCVSLIAMITGAVTVASTKGVYVAAICALLFIAASAAWAGYTISKLEKRIKDLESR